MTPTPQQAAAIDLISEWFGHWQAIGQQVFYLAGYAGTGKSTVTETALEALRTGYGISKIETGAYTGKAASVMRKKGVSNARTIHSMIYTPIEDPETGKIEFTLDPVGAAADADLIVLDECSMVGDDMAKDVLSYNRPILVMGDPGQLPPIRGAGFFTNRQPDVFLTEVHRQAAESPILRLATMARRGERIALGDYGQNVRVLLLDRESQNEVYREETQPICGIHRVRWTITQRGRAKRGFEGPVPLKGERIICCKNDKELGIFNGQLGIAANDAYEIDPGCRVLLDAVLEDREKKLKNLSVHPYLFEQHFSGPRERPRIPRGMHEFDWGDVLTCHKAQGSEFPHVTVVDDSRSFPHDADRWLYTAITRASEGLTILKRSA